MATGYWQSVQRMNRATGSAPSSQGGQWNHGVWQPAVSWASAGQQNLAGMARIDPMEARRRGIAMPSAAPGGGGDAGPGDLRAEFQRQMDAANQANEARYQQGLGELEGSRSRTLKALKHLGKTRRGEIAEQAGNEAARLRQWATDTGTANTTIGPTLQMGVLRDRQRAETELGERVATARADADANLTRDKVGFIERRNDIAPDFSQLMQLEMMRGQGNLAGIAPAGGGGGSTGGPAIGGSGYGLPTLAAGRSGVSAREQERQALIRLNNANRAAAERAAKQTRRTPLRIQQPYVGDIKTNQTMMYA